jgi:hypothetical protein
MVFSEGRELADKLRGTVFSGNGGNGVSSNRAATGSMTAGLLFASLAGLRAALVDDKTARVEEEKKPRTKCGAAATATTKLVELALQLACLPSLQRVITADGNSYVFIIYLIFLFNKIMDKIFKKQ